MEIWKEIFKTPAWNVNLVSGVPHIINLANKTGMVEIRVITQPCIEGKIEIYWDRIARTASFIYTREQPATITAIIVVERVIFERLPLSVIPTILFSLCILWGVLYIYRMPPEEEK